MSLLSRALGLARSVAIYHAIPLRQRRLRRLYADFVGPGDLVFDVGAHAGNRARALAALGCRIVAIEPQPDFARLLRTIFAAVPRVEVIQAAVGRTAGRAPLWISERTPSVTTMASEWRDARARDPDFTGVRWNRRLEVEVITLDGLIDRFGVPAFIKVDVEGAEPEVLDGLTRAVAALSFEYLPHALDRARACIARLTALGPYRFNWSSGESYRLASRTWLNDVEVLRALDSDHAQHKPGDVYALHPRVL